MLHDLKGAMFQAPHVRSIAWGRRIGSDVALVATELRSLELAAALRPELALAPCRARHRMVGHWSRTDLAMVADNARQLSEIE